MGGEMLTVNNADNGWCFLFFIFYFAPKNSLYDAIVWAPHFVFDLATVGQKIVFAFSYHYCGKENQMKSVQFSSVP